MIVQNFANVALYDDGTHGLLISEWNHSMYNGSRTWLVPYGTKKPYIARWPILISSSNDGEIYYMQDWLVAFNRPDQYGIWLALFSEGDGVNNSCNFHRTWEGIDQRYLIEDEVASGLRHIEAIEIRDDWSD